MTTGHLRIWGDGSPTPSGSDPDETEPPRLGDVDEGLAPEPIIGELPIPGTEVGQVRTPSQGSAEGAGRDAPNPNPEGAPEPEEVELPSALLDCPRHHSDLCRSFGRAWDYEFGVFDRTFSSGAS